MGFGFRGSLLGVGGVMSESGYLKKRWMSLLIAGLVLVSAGISGVQAFSAIPGIGNIDLSSMKVVPFVQA